MDTNVGDFVHCEEQLRTTLHCDDKEKVIYFYLPLQLHVISTMSLVVHPLTFMLSPLSFVGSWHSYQGSIVRQHRDYR